MSITNKSYVPILLSLSLQSLPVTINCIFAHQLYRIELTWSFSSGLNWIDPAANSFLAWSCLNAVCLLVAQNLFYHSIIVVLATKFSQHLVLVPKSLLISRYLISSIWYVLFLIIPLIVVTFPWDSSLADAFPLFSLADAFLSSNEIGNGLVFCFGGSS